MGKIEKHTEYYCDICGDKRMIDDEMYETCKDCPYYYGEINQCMYGEEDVPNNLEKKCEEGGK